MDESSSNQRTLSTLDGNEAVASVAFRVNEVIAIYPITPASVMGELCDEWSSQGRKNIWGQVPEVVEMQSEAGAAGTVHGSLQAGALTTTFTASQGLLLMIPNLYKIAGELTPFVLHVAARTLATHALSIFGDHQDVMACRQTGMAMLCSGSVQEAHDLAVIAHSATLDCRVPFIHFFDGFRTSHEINRIEMLTDADLLSMMDPGHIQAHRDRALSPDRPVVRGTAQNPDAFFQAREACNPWYAVCPEKVQQAMDRFAALTGRSYHLFDYVGHPEAERVIVMMGSGAECVHETLDWLAEHRPEEKVGLLRIRLFRPFSVDAFIGALPRTTQAIAVLDRTKEPGSTGEPLYQDIRTALLEAEDEGRLPMARMPKVIGGRYGLSSKEFTPAMVLAVFDELKKSRPKNHFTIGIMDDISFTSLPYDEDFDLEGSDVVRAVFFGLGADGTVGSNKNSIKIIGEETGQSAQGYFVYDSKKSGAITISHLRFGPKPIRSTYKIRRASFVACHQPFFLERYDMLDYAAPGAIFLLNSPHGPERVWETLPVEVQSLLVERGLRFFVIDAFKVAGMTGMGRQISTIMQTCFFALSGVLPRDEAIARIKYAIDKTYGKKGLEIVRRNYAAVDQALSHLHEVAVPKAVSATRSRPPVISDLAPDFVKNVTAVMMAQKGDALPVSAFPVDGTWPTGTTRWEKRNIALQIPIWDSKICIQCNKCVFVCPHSAIRAQAYEPSHLEQAPASFPSMPFKGTEVPGGRYTIQVAPEDCTGCSLCVAVCPAKDKSNPRHKAIDMLPHAEHVERERVNYDFFLGLPPVDRTQVKADIKSTQLLEPLFEYSGACAGCGETPYIKLLTQLFGDRLLIANATGCSSIYGANLPTTPYTTNKDGRGPAWANSLFEDNAEFGLGFRLSLNAQQELVRALLVRQSGVVGEVLVNELLSSDQSTEAGIAAQRARVEVLKQKLMAAPSADGGQLLAMADLLVQKSVWLVGGDGWAYDIGYGGLDHVLASHRNINVLVLDTEVYSNTGGQASKSTPLGAAAKFASAGKSVAKKDLGMLAMTYGHVYVARVAFGAKDAQTVKAFQEAESYPGPSLILAYSHCIAHGYDMAFGLDQQKKAVDSGIWPLYRFDPRRIEQGEAPLQLDSAPGKIKVREYMKGEARFMMVEKQDPKRFAHLQELAERVAHQRFALYQQLSEIHLPSSRDSGTDGAKTDGSTSGNPS